jgi:hypothetical protein
MVHTIDIESKWLIPSTVAKGLRLGNQGFKIDRGQYNIFSLGPNESKKHKIKRPISIIYI